MCKIPIHKNNNKTKSELPTPNKDVQEVLEGITRSLEDTTSDFHKFLDAEIIERAKINVIEQKVIKNIEAYDKEVNRTLTKISELQEQNIAKTEEELRVALDQGDKEATVNLLKKMTEEYKTK